MKKIIFIFLVSLSVSIWSETEFSGTAEITAMGLIPIDSYASPINPDNQIMKLNDFSVSPSLILRIDAYDEYSNFESLFKVTNYPIGSLLYDPTSDTAPMMEAIFTEIGESITTFNILRFFIDYSPLENLTLSIGRKSYFMGFGYGWNPVDNLNQRKNPEDPNSELLGIDSVSAVWNLNNLLSIRLITALNRGLFNMGSDYDDLSIAGDLTLVLDGIEIITTGYINLNKDLTDRVNSIAFAFKKDIFGIGLYGEGIYLDYHDYKVNYLIGAEYLFETDTFVTFEYFYNDEGMTKDERLDYKVLLETDPTPLHNSGYYAKQYILINLSQSLYDYNTTLGLAAIYSLDSTNLILAPSMDIDISENMNLNFSYSGMMDFNKDDFTETDLSPVKHGFSLTYKYSF